MWVVDFVRHFFDTHSAAVCHSPPLYIPRVVTCHRLRFFQSPEASTFLISIFPTIFIHHFFYLYLNFLLKKKLKLPSITETNKFVVHRKHIENTENRHREFLLFASYRDSKTWESQQKEAKPPPKTHRCSLVKRRTKHGGKQSRDLRRPLGARSAFLAWTGRGYSFL